MQLRILIISMISFFLSFFLFLFFFLKGGDHADPITHANTLSNSISGLLHNAKGLLRLAGSDTVSEGLISDLKGSAIATRDFFNTTKSNSIMNLEPQIRSESIMSKSRELMTKLGQVVKDVEGLVPKDISLITAGQKEDELGDVVEREMMAAAKAIEEATSRLMGIKSQPSQHINRDVHTAIFDSTLAITSAIATLIKCATITQQEIVSQGKGGGSKGAFYKKNNRWTEGLISAAKSVAVATTHLVETADGLVQGKKSLEQLAVAANEVSAATTQLVAAARVKAGIYSKTQERLESAAKAVRQATDGLVKAAKQASQKSAEERILEEVKSMGAHEFKVKEMEQQVRILELEKELNMARQKLGEMRKSTYHQ